MGRRYWGVIGMTENRIHRESILQQEYYNWLCDLIHVNQEHKSYWVLAQALHKKSFRWFVPNDDNRAFEAKELRGKFCDENRLEYYYDSFPEDPSMLELTIALAYCCESTMVDQGYGDVVDWFWRIMSNVGLDKFTDDDYFDYGGNAEVNRILDRINDRTYHRDGRGSLFPLRKAKKDQRKVELWYQMSAYLVENYYTDSACI
jgi:hypothetical protein